MKELFVVMYRGRYLLQCYASSKEEAKRIAKGLMAGKVAHVGH